MIIDNNKIKNNKEKKKMHHYHDDMTEIKGDKLCKLLKW